MSNDALRAILQEWSACTISLEDAEKKLRECLGATEPTKEKRGVSLMQQFATKFNVAMSLTPTFVPLDKYLSDYDQKFGGFGPLQVINAGTHTATIQPIYGGAGVEVHFLPR